jgi:hypothetical protein
MNAFSRRWRALAYLFGGLYLLSFVSLIVFYEWLRYFGARQPNSATGEIIARRMQQPFDVYLTKAECGWLDWALVPLLALLGVAFWAQRRWKSAQSNENVPS